MTDLNPRRANLWNWLQHKKRVLVVAVLCILALPIATTTTEVMHADTGESLQRSAVSRRMQATSTAALNVTALWEEIWSQASEESIYNLTRGLSEAFPSRVWDAMRSRPSTTLLQAQQWANATLSALTGGQLYFNSLGQYNVLYAVQNGTGEYPRPAIVVNGIIDSTEDTPGANDVAVSVAAVLETARVLHEIPLAVDVYYVLTSTGRAGMEHDPSAQEFAQFLEDRQVHVLTAISYDRLLFHRTQFPYGTLALLRSLLDSSIYQRTDWIPDLMVTFSNNIGTGRLQKATDKGYSEHALAREFWIRNTSAVYVAQGYFYDSLSGGIDDDVDEFYYSFAKAREVVASAAGVIALIGRAAEGKVLSHCRSGQLLNGTTTSFEFALSATGFVNATIQWDGNATVYARFVRVESSRVVYERTEDDGLVHLKYLCGNYGRYRLVITNLGPDSIAIRANVTVLSDTDGDSLFDSYEVADGLNPYLLDTDGDGLEDNFEIAIGSDPHESDSDNDGALDSDEYMWGSSLVLVDTDGDNITDGEEAAIGTSPVKIDTDGDGISDYEELVVYGSNPLTADTDGDGLDDAFEITTGLNATAVDTDGDGLDDLFEILNHIDPLSVDTDGDGWTDAYEVYHYMSPTRSDTDGDLIPDTWDWNPQRHWVESVAPVSIITIVSLLAIFAYLKHRVYVRGAARPQGESE